MMQRPKFCPDITCTPINSFLGGDTQFCFGKLAKAGDHGNIKALNDLSWCLDSGGFSRWLLNRDDLITFFVASAKALRDTNQAYPDWVKEHIR